MTQTIGNIFMRLNSQERIEDTKRKLVPHPLSDYPRSKTMLSPNLQAYNFHTEFKIENFEELRKFKRAKLFQCQRKNPKFLIVRCKC